MSYQYDIPHAVSTLLSGIVTAGKPRLDAVLDFACGSGDLLLSVCQQIGKANIGAIYGQDANADACTAARVLLQENGLNGDEFSIYHGDALAHGLPLPGECDAVLSCPPRTEGWKPTQRPEHDPRFAEYGVPPKFAADYAYLLHGLHHLSDNGVMAILSTRGVLFRGGVERRIRTKLLQNHRIDAVIDLPANLFESTGIPTCILVLRKDTPNGDVLMIDASKHFNEGRWQNTLSEAHVDKIMDAYTTRQEEAHYARIVSLDEIRDNEYSLSVDHYVLPPDLPRCGARQPSQTHKRFYGRF